MAFEGGTIPNSLRPASVRDDRPVIYLCFRTWEPRLKWSARLDSCSRWVFSDDREDAVTSAVIEGSPELYNDVEALIEAVRAVRIKTFEVRPPKTGQRTVSTSSHPARGVHAGHTQRS